MRAKVTVDFHAPRRPYWPNLGEAVSQAMGALVGLDANLTFSAHCGRWQEESTPILQHLHRLPNITMSIPRIIRGQGIDHDHCLRSWRNLI
jgi:hypothetical protein